MYICDAHDHLVTFTVGGNHIHSHRRAEVAPSLQEISAFHCLATDYQLEFNQISSTYILLNS